MNVLKHGGRAAIVLPDNCLFENKAGEVFEILMHDCNLHTVLRLPRGTFTPYSQGVKANVIFFQKGLPTENVWIFDARSNVPGITKKDRPLTPSHFAEFEKCYGKDPNGYSKRIDTGELGRFRKFHINEIKEFGYKLDIHWLKDESIDDITDLPEPSALVEENITTLESVVDELRKLMPLLEKNGEQPMNNIPESWRKYKLGYIAQRITKGATPTSYGFKYQDRGIRFVKVENIRHGRINVASIRDFISEEANLNQKRSILVAADILLSIAGTIGVSCLVEEEDLPANTKQALAIIRGAADVLEPKFLRYQLESDVSSMQFRQKERGGGMNNISLEDVKQFEISIAPLKEQRRIVEKLDKLMRKIDYIETQLNGIPNFYKRSSLCNPCKGIPGGACAAGPE
jgi:hypothetical protein